MTRIAVIGEYDPKHPTHPATDAALGHSAAALGTTVDVTRVKRDPRLADVRGRDPFTTRSAVPGSRPYDPSSDRNRSIESCATYSGSSCPRNGPVAGVSSCRISALTKKNARSRRIGPPIENPY